MGKSYNEYWSAKGEYGRIRIERTNERKRKRNVKKDKAYICEKCGDVKSFPIQKVEDPYSKEMHGSSCMMRLCGWCYEASCGDI